jgi:hypothetical protein
VSIGGVLVRHTGEHVDDYEEPPHMHAVLIEVDVAGVDRDEGLRAVREHIVPAISHMPGFHSGTWLTGDDDGKGLSLTVWETEDDARAMVERFGPGSSPTMGASVVRCELREVAATAGLPSSSR